MKISDITLVIMCQQIREYEENLDSEEKTSLLMMKDAAISYVKEYTGLNSEQLNKYDDITIVVLSLIAEMWDNHTMIVDKANSNMLITSILGMHSNNLLPQIDE